MTAPIHPTSLLSATQSVMSADIEIAKENKHPHPELLCSLVNKGASTNSIAQSHNLYELLTLENPDDLELSMVPQQTNILRVANEVFLEEYKLVKNRFKKIDLAAEKTIGGLQREFLSNSTVLDELKDSKKDSILIKNLYNFIKIHDVITLSQRELSFIISTLRDLKAFSSETDKFFGEAVKGVKRIASQHKIKELKKLIKHIGIQNLTSEELATVFYALKFQGGFKEMVELYDDSKNADFKDSPIIRELIAVALNKIGDLERSEQEIQRLIDNGYPSGEVYAILGKVKKLEYQSTRDPQQLTDSMATLEKGFLTGFELYPGINLVYNSITQSLVEENGNIENYKKAQKLAEMVYISCEKAGGERSNDYWALVTMLEASVILESDQTSKLLPLVLDKDAADWEIQAPIENLKNLKTQIEKYGDRFEDKQKKIDKINLVLTALEKKLESLSIDSVHKLIIQAIENKDIEMLNRSKVLAKTIFSTASHQRNGFWKLKQEFKTFILFGWHDKVNEILPQILEEGSPIELKSLSQSIEEYRKLLEKDKTWMPNVDEQILLLDTVNQEISKKLTFHREHGDISEVTKEVFDRGFYFGEIKSNSVGGNIQYGGQLQTRVVNRWDYNIARGILNHLHLNTNSDFNTFNTVIDKLIRERCKTDKMEFPDSQDHVDFDDFRKFLIPAMGISSNRKCLGDDSRTNIFVDFLIGELDCRHHADIKQLFFDIWKTENINNHMEKAYRAFSENNLPEFELHMKKAEKLAKIYMLNFDSNVIGRPKNDKSKEFKVLEPHTLNVLVKLDNNGNIVLLSDGRPDFRLVDSFHQIRYQFGTKSETKGEDAGILVDPRGILTTGISAGETIKNGEVYEVKIVPIYYAGDRKKKKIEPNQDEFGQVRFMGMQVAKLSEKGDCIDISPFVDLKSKTIMDSFVISFLRTFKTAA